MARAVFILVAFAALLLSGCVQQPEQPLVQEPPSPVVQPPPVQQTPCSTGNIVQKDDCNLALAKEKNDQKVCKSIYDVVKLDQCYAAFAGNDLEACKMIRDAGVKNGCLAENAKSRKSEEICGLIDAADARAACLGQVLPACQLILDPAGRELCIALEKKDYTACGSDQCFALYAENTSDAAACGLIKSESDRFYCMATVKKSAETCKQASLAPLQDLCVEKFAKKFNDVGACDLATSGSAYASECYLYFAVKTGNIDYCRKPLQEEQRDQCYTDYAIQAANTSSCPRIINSLNRIACYYYAAGQNRMPSLCNPLETEDQRNDCYAKGIVPELGPIASDCKNVYSDEWRNKCYFKVARLTYDATMCGLITPGPDRASCDQLFGQ